MLLYYNKKPKKHNIMCFRRNENMIGHNIRAHRPYWWDSSILFKSRQITGVWDDLPAEWYFSISDSPFNYYPVFWFSGFGKEFSEMSIWKTLSNKVKPWCDELNFILMYAILWDHFCISLHQICIIRWLCKIP